MFLDIPNVCITNQGTKKLAKIKIKEPKLNPKDEEYLHSEREIYTIGFVFNFKVLFPTCINLVVEKYRFQEEGCFVA